MHGIEQRIRESAYLLWELEGRPEGRELEYWERARLLIGAGNADHDASKPTDGGLNGAKSAGHSKGKHGLAASASTGSVAKPPGGKRHQIKAKSSKPASRKK